MVVFPKLPKAGMEVTVSELVLEVVRQQTPRRESQSDSRIVKTSSECLQGSRKQPIIAVYELDTTATREFQTFVGSSEMRVHRWLADIRVEVSCR
jgi:hypothetical protein